MVNTWFYRYAKNKTFVISNRVIYEFTDFKTKDYFKQNGQKVYLVKAEKLSKLEKIFLRDIGDTNFKLVNEFFEASVVQKDFQNIISSLIPQGNFLMNNDSLYELKKIKKGSFKINRKKYDIIDKKVSLESIEEKYSNWLKDHISIDKKYYSDDLGYKIINNNFFIYTKIDKYELYNPKDNQFYKFPQADLAAKLDIVDDIVIKGLFILNKYSHPALPEFDKPMQKICTGSIKPNDYYKSLKGSSRKKIKLLLKFGKNIISKGYTSNAKPYHNLNNYNFKKYGGVDFG